MAKLLKDILKAAHDQIKGVRPSETGQLSIGKDPGVDYKPKAADEADFIAKHSVQKWDDPAGNPNFADKVNYSMDSTKEKHHGNTESKAKAANEETINELSPATKSSYRAKSGDEAKRLRTRIGIMNKVKSDDDVVKSAADHVKKDMKRKLNNRVDGILRSTRSEETDTGFSESKKAEDVSCNNSPAGTKCPMHEMADCTMSRTIKEGGMPASVIKSKQHRANMTDKEFADSHKDKSDADLRSMAWRHGHGKPGTPGHDHYVNRRNRGLKEEVEQIDELSTDLLHRAAHKAAKMAMTDVQGRSGPIFKKRAAQANKFRAKGMEQEKKEKAAKSVKEETIDEVVVNRKMTSKEKSAHAEYLKKHSEKLAAHDTGTSTPKKSFKDVNTERGDYTHQPSKMGLRHAMSAGYYKAEEVEHVAEVLTKSTTAGETIHDFVHSDNPKFKGKSKEERKKMALGAYYAKQNEANAVEPLLGGDDAGHDEGAEMVKAELKAIANKAMHLVTQMPGSMHIEPWCQAKIAQAKSMVNDVHDYMIYGDHKDEEDEQNDTPITLPNMSVDVNTGQNV